MSYCAITCKKVVNRKERRKEEDSGDTFREINRLIVGLKNAM
jgi:hypothetical protein